MRYERCSDWFSHKHRDGAAPLPPVNHIVMVQYEGRWGKAEIPARYYMGEKVYRGGIIGADGSPRWVTLNGDHIVPTAWAHASRSSLRRSCWNWVCELVRNRKRDKILSAPDDMYANMKRSAVNALHALDVRAGKG